MHRGRIFVLSVLCFTFLTFPAQAQVKHESKSEPRPSGSGVVNDRAYQDEGKAASGEEPDFTRFRIVTDQGILAVFDADHFQINGFYI